MQNMGIFFFFLLCLLLKSNFEALLIERLTLPNTDKNLEITNQNLKTELKNLETAFELEEKKENTIYSRVLFRDPYKFFDTITILKGEEDGIHKNVAVLNGKNLIGLIEKTNKHDSIVTLLSNETSKVSVKIKDAYGIMTTNKNRECWIKNLSKTVEVEKGNLVTTSGLTNYPAEIMVGTVEEIKMNDLGLVQEIKVAIAADLNEINYITIMEKEMTK